MGHCIVQPALMANVLTCEWLLPLPRTSFRSWREATCFYSLVREAFDITTQPPVTI